MKIDRRNIFLKNANFYVFREAFQELHLPLKFKVEKWKSSSEKNLGNFVQVLNFLNVSFTLNQNVWLETDIFYKATNSHDYLN